MDENFSLSSLTMYLSQHPYLLKCGKAMAHIVMDNRSGVSCCCCLAWIYRCLYHSLVLFTNHVGISFHGMKIGCLVSFLLVIIPSSNPFQFMTLLFLAFLKIVKHCLLLMSITTICFCCCLLYVLCLFVCHP